MKNTGGLGEQGEQGEGFEMPSNKQTKQCNEDAREHREDESFLRHPSHPQDEVPAWFLTQTLDGTAARGHRFTEKDSRP